MTLRKSKKSRKQRGNRTHGWGAGKKHRGTGHIGGHGKSNVGKRGAARKTKYLAKGIKPIGKHGMKVIRMRKKDKIINIRTIYEKLDSWIKQGKVKKQKNGYIIDLEKLSYTKLLGGGKIRDKLNIIVPKMSKKSKQKLNINN